MDQRVTLVTLGVADLARSVAFYAKLGWTPGNDWEAQDVAFFQCVGMGLALWDRTEVARDGETEAHPPGATTIAYNASSPAEVDAVLDEAAAAGAEVKRRGGSTDWGGYNGVFHDPDGHAWEIAHNPFWTLHEDGSITLGTDQT